MLLFSNFTSGGHQGGHPFQNFGFERHHNFQKKNQKFQNFKLKQIVPCPPWCPPDVRFEKSNTSAFTGKKINVVKFFKDFLSLKTSTLCKSVIFKRFICQHNSTHFQLSLEKMKFQKAFVRILQLISSPPLMWTEHRDVL